MVAPAGSHQGVEGTSGYPLSLEQVGMRPGALERDRLAGYAVDQDPVGTYVAIAMAPPLSGQPVIPAPFVEGVPMDEVLHHRA